MKPINEKHQSISGGKKLMTKYPFTPKSTAYLKPGHFWSIPLNNGRFACGRVIELPPKGEAGSKTLFLAGLMDWVGREPPTYESIAGCKIIEQGNAHIKTIHENGGEILGFRPLEEDNLEPRLSLSQAGGGQYCLLQRGYKTLRRATEEERKLYPVFSTWGYGVIRKLAEKHFGGIR